MDIRTQSKKFLAGLESRKRNPAKPRRAASSLTPQFTSDEAAVERAVLASEARFAGWSPAQLRAKQAWVTMRTIGWTAPSAQKAGA